MQFSWNEHKIEIIFFLAIAQTYDKLDNFISEITFSIVLYFELFEIFCYATITKTYFESITLAFFVKLQSTKLAKEKFLGVS